MITRLCVIILSVTAAGLAGGTPNFRIINSLNYLPPPKRSRGVFYSEGNIPGSTVSLAFSITTQGTTTQLASFQGNQVNMTSRLVGAGNARFYTSIETSSYPAQVFSVSAQANSQQVYAAQNFVPSFSGGLPDGSILGAAGGNGIYVISSTLEGVVTPVYQFLPNQALPSASRGRQ
jgi:hypothetical protein